MLNWGLIGAGEIARVFANGLRFSRSGLAVAVASQTPGKAAALASDFAIPGHYTSYEALLADPQVEAVYISTIHPFHAEWTIKAAQAGKHILVEKPIAMNAAEAAAMIQAARDHDVFLMEAFMYRCHPQIRAAVDLIHGGAVGKVRFIRTTFSIRLPFNPAGRIYAKEQGGGGMLDVGCYPASMARLLAGAAIGLPFADPVAVKGCGVLGPTGVDHQAAATVQFDGGIIAEMLAGVDCEVPIEVAAYGETGSLAIRNPWLPSTPCRFATGPLPPDTQFPSETIVLTTYATAAVQEITVPADRDLFSYEADMVAAHIQDRQAPAMSWADSLGNMQLLDRWRAEIGLVYPQDRR